MPIVFGDGQAAAELRRMRRRGQLALPSGERGQMWARQAQSMAREPGGLRRDVEAFYNGPNRLGREALDRYNSRLSGINRETLAQMDPKAVEMFHRRTAAEYPGGGLGIGLSPTGAMSGDVQLAWPRYRDPFRYWREKAWWFVSDDWDETLRKMREWVRLLYLTHPLVPTCVDLYSRLPFRGFEFRYAKDKRVAEFANELFLDELDMQGQLYDAGRLYWTDGEFFSLGSWNDALGSWDGFRFLNPDDVQVAKNPGLAQWDFHVKVPDSIRRLVETQQPMDEYKTLIEEFPEVANWARENKELPVSDVLLKHEKFAPTPWSEHGVPILMRAFRVLMLEMALEAAQDAVSDRLYAPFILAKVGFEDIDDAGPWIPEPSEIEAVRDDVAMNLMADFRLMVYHAGLDIQNVFGRENMPRLDLDFDRVDAKLLQVFGIGREMLEGGKSGVPYAVGAMNREVINLNLEAARHWANRYLKARWEVVADAQGIYEYERKGDQRIPVMERAVIYREIDGTEEVVERPKLAQPDRAFADMSLRDENLERQFMQAMKMAGVPVSDGTMMVSVQDWEFGDELDAVREEKLRKVRAELEFQQQLFLTIYASTLEGTPLPVPMMYAQAYVAWVQQVQGVAPPVALPDITEPASAPNMGGPEEAAPVMGEGGATAENDAGQQGAGLGVAGPAGMAPAFSSRRREAAVLDSVSSLQDELRRMASADPKWARESIRTARRDLARAEKETARRRAREAKERDAAEREALERAGVEEGESLRDTMGSLVDKDGDPFSYEGREEFSLQSIEYFRAHESRFRRKMGAPRRLRLRPREDAKEEERHASFGARIAGLMEQPPQQMFDRLAGEPPEPEGEGSGGPEANGEAKGFQP